MAEVFSTVLMTSLYAVVVGLVIVLLKGVLKHRLSAQWHYLIWMVLILKLLIPFGPESAVSIFNAVPEIPPVGIPEVAYQMESPDAVAPASESPWPDNNEPNQPPANANQNQVMMLAGNLLPYIWITGVVLMLLWLGVTYFSLYRKLRQRSAAADERIAGIFASCKTRMQINSNLTLIVQDAISVPSLFGLLHPKILLTPAASNLSDSELQYILLHEMAHYKRKDVLVNCFLIILQTIHWFNPVIWYCFKRIRQDMEVAADERVLSVLENTEHRDYGRALLTVLEGFTASNLSPKLLGMADDKKNIEIRLQMIKMAEFFQNQRKHMSLVGVLCLVVLGGVLLTSGLNQPDTVSASANTYDAKTLIKFKTDYVGDNSKVVNLISQLPLASQRQVVSLQTKTAPYGITVNYDFRNSGINPQQIRMTLRNNAAVMFALIKNVDNITYNVRMPESSEQSSFQCTRIEIQNDFPNDLGEYSKSIDVFEPFLKYLTFNLYVYPKQYATAMSSTPGIRFFAEYEGPASKVRYSAESGILVTWDAPGGKVSKGSRILEVSYGNPVYWSPVEANGQISTDDYIEITVAILDKNGQKLSERQALIVYDDSFYSVSRSSSGVIYGRETLATNQPTDLNDAVGRAIKSRSSSYLEGEAATEGHIILDTEEQNGTVKVYNIASLGVFGFENGIFTKVSGSGAIPTVMTFSKNQKGEYELLDYKEPEDGSLYVSSIKKMFPRRLQDRVLADHEDYSNLKKQQEEQAREYLKSIGRAAEVSAAHVWKKLPDIDVEASNKLFAEYAKNDAFVNACPYWLGTRESIENGERVIYETAQSKTSDGHAMITFRKTRANGTVVEEQRYKIVGSVIRSHPIFN